MYNKFYIHHSYDKNLFYKFFHNTNSIHTDGDIITFYYNKNRYEVIFSENIHDNSDGYHLIDFITLKNKTNLSTLDTYKKVNEILKDKQNWIVSIFLAEKILLLSSIEENIYNDEHEVYLYEILDKNIILTDNTIIRNPNKKIITDRFHYCFTNSIFNWNDIMNLRWFYEFKQIFEKLNFDFKIGFSVRRLKQNRLDILKGLDKLNNKNLFLQITNFLYQIPEHTNDTINTSINDIIKKHSNIKLNDISGKFHFDDLNLLSSWNYGIDYDLFFRYLSKAQIQILDESWSNSTSNFKIQYLSEKTLGYILSNVPFIPTHPYPLEIIHSVFDINQYPFYEDIKKCKKNPKKFVEFIKSFMDDYDSNYLILKEWSDSLHTSFIYKMYNENSFLDKIEKNFINDTNYLTEPIL